MKVPDHRNLFLFVVYPFVALILAVCAAVILFAAWPATLVYNPDKKPAEPAKDTTHD